MHNRVIHFINEENLKEYLPTRQLFVENKRPESTYNIVNNQIKNREPILFLGNDVLDMVNQSDGSWKYRLIIIGITRCGSKAALVIDDIKPNFSIEIPPNTDANIFKDELKEILKHERLFVDMKLIKAKPGDTFVLDQKDYIKIKTSTRISMDKCIKFLRANEITYTDRGGVKNIYLNLVFDKAWDYYLKVSRERKIYLCGWNVIENYKIDSSSTLFKNKSNYWVDSVHYVFKISKKNIKNIDEMGIDMMSEEYADLLKDKTIMMNWDLETYSKHSTGNVPDASLVHDKTDILDRIFMASIVFSWTYSNKSMYRVCITDLPSPERDDCLTIQVKDQEQLLLVMAIIIESMSPDYISGFQDMFYDWPFVNNRIVYHKLLEYYQRKLSVIRFRPSDAKYIVPGPYNRDQVKFEAGESMYVNYFKAPGYICLDTRITYMQMYPKTEQSSLNFYLKKFNLGTKEDMPYTTMFQIYRIWRQIKAQEPKIRTFKQLMTYLCKLRELYGENYKPYENIALHNPCPHIDDDHYNINLMTITDIIYLMGGVEYGGATNEGITQVINYCNIDAMKCQELLLQGRVILDKREKGNLSFVGFYETVFKADAMKVRNLLISVGCEEKFNLMFTMKNKPMTKKKYPGAHVVPPKRGLSRDDHLIKKCRRLGIPVEQAIPGPNFNNDLLDNTNDDYINKILSIDENNMKDLPCAGLDFSSLYPSLIMTYNLSPDKAVEDEEMKIQLENMGYELLYVEFHYKEEKEQNNDTNLIKGWFVQHTHPVAIKIKKVIRVAQEKYGEDWVSHINIDFINKCKDALLNTSIDEWHKYGMGLYPYILKQLFDKRKSIKKTMGTYVNALEVFKSLYKIGEQISFDEMINRFDISIANIMEELLIDDNIVNKNNLRLVQGTKQYMLDNMGQFETMEQLYLYTTTRFGYYNSKQNALKVYMNTFYGSMGQDTSPLFKVLCAGAVTCFGIKNIKMVKSYVEKLGYIVNYGDTDSLYISPPHIQFDDIFDLYINRKITKLQYWEELVKISMTSMDKLGILVNNYLMLDNGTLFLSMAYEEVLFPYALLGKKKYIGIKHENIVNFNACREGITLEEFMENKSIFIRGLDIVRRGTSELTKYISYSIFHKAFNVNNTDTFKDIILSELDIASKKDWDINYYIKSAKYKLPKSGKPGNIPVLQFVDRMQHLFDEEKHFGIKPPDVGERFNYIVKKRNPYVVNLRGVESKIKKDKGMGLKYEFVHTLQNQEYQKAYGIIEIDKDYYMKSVIGQLARFIIYHTDYGGKETTVDIPKDVYKKLDEKAYLTAKKKLYDHYMGKYGSKYYKPGKISKKIYNVITSTQSDNLENIFGRAAPLIQNITHVNIDVDKYNICEDGHILDLYNRLISNIEKNCVKNKIVPNVNEMIKKLNMDVYDFYIKLVGTERNEDTFYRSRLKQIKRRYTDLSYKFRNILPLLQKNQFNYITYLENVVNKYKKEKYADMFEKCITSDKDIEYEDEVDDNWFSNLIQYEDSDDNIKYVYEAYDIYVELYSLKLIMVCINDIIVWAIHLKNKGQNNNVKPAFLNDNKNRTDFRKMMEMKFRKKDLDKNKNQSSKTKLFIPNKL